MGNNPSRGGGGGGCRPPPPRTGPTFYEHDTDEISPISYLFSYFWSDSDSNTDNVNHVG